MENLGDKLDALSSTLLNIGITYVDIIIFVMIMGLTLYFDLSRAFTITAPVLNDTSCSAVRPPISTATFVFRGIKLPHQINVLVDQAAPAS